MAERREDVEELLRLKNNPFPDGTLEAPEFPRRVYASNVVQPVNAQLVGQSSTGPKQVAIDTDGTLKVEIPQSYRPCRKILSVRYTTQNDWASGAAQYFNTIPDTGYIFSIINVTLHCSAPIGSTNGYIYIYLVNPVNNENLLWIYYTYNVNIVVDACDFTYGAIDYRPHSTDAFINHLHQLRFDTQMYPKWVIFNSTNGTISKTGFELDVVYLEEQY